MLVGGDRQGGWTMGYNAWANFKKGGIEREIDDLYNIENKIHIDVDAFSPPPISPIPNLQKMLDESKK